MKDLSGIGMNFFLLVLIGSLLVGFCEEMVTRDQLIVGLRGAYTEPRVWFLSTLLFALLHLPNWVFGARPTASLQVVLAFGGDSLLYLTRMCVVAVWVHPDDSHDAVRLTRLGTSLMSTTLMRSPMPHLSHTCSRQAADRPKQEEGRAAVRCSFAGATVANLFMPSWTFHLLLTDHVYLRGNVASTPICVMTGGHVYGLGASVVLCPTPMRQSSWRFRMATSRAVAAVKRVKVVEAVAAGATYEEAAEQAGYATRSGAYKALWRELDARVADAVDDLRMLEVQRLDALQVAAWDKAMAGDVKAILAAAVEAGEATIVGIEDDIVAILGPKRYHELRGMLMELLASPPQPGD